MSIVILAYIKMASREDSDAQIMRAELISILHAIYGDDLDYNMPIKKLQKLLAQMNANDEVKVSKAPVAFSDEGWNEALQRDQQYLTDRPWILDPFNDVEVASKRTINRIFNRYAEFVSPPFDVNGNVSAPPTVIDFVNLPDVIRGGLDPRPANLPYILPTAKIELPVMRKITSTRLVTHMFKEDKKASKQTIETFKNGMKAPNLSLRVLRNLSEKYLTDTTTKIVRDLGLPENHKLSVQELFDLWWIFLTLDEGKKDEFLQRLPQIISISPIDLYAELVKKGYNGESYFPIMIASYAFNGEITAYAKTFERAGSNSNVIKDMKTLMIAATWLEHAINRRYSTDSLSDKGRVQFLPGYAFSKMSVGNNKGKALFTMPDITETFGKFLGIYYNPDTENDVLKATFESFDSSVKVRHSGGLFCPINEVKSLQSELNKCVADWFTPEFSGLRPTVNKEVYIGDSYQKSVQGDPFIVRAHSRIPKKVGDNERLQPEVTVYYMTLEDLMYVLKKWDRRVGRPPKLPKRLATDTVKRLPVEFLNSYSLFSKAYYNTPLDFGWKKDKKITVPFLELAVKSPPHITYNFNSYLSILLVEIRREMNLPASGTVIQQGLGLSLEVNRVKLITIASNFAAYLLSLSAMCEGRRKLTSWKTQKAPLSEIRENLAIEECYWRDFLRLENEPVVRIMLKHELLLFQGKVNMGKFEFIKAVPSDMSIRNNSIKFFLSRRLFRPDATEEDLLEYSSYLRGTALFLLYDISKEFNFASPNFTSPVKSWMLEGERHARYAKKAGVVSTFYEKAKRLGSGVSQIEDELISMYGSVLTWTV